MTEIEEIEKKIDDFVKPFEARLRELKNQREDEYKAEKEKLYKANIAGRLFYGDYTTWHGFTDVVQLIKPDDSINWDRYDSCDGFEIKLHYTDMRWNRDNLRERKFERLEIKREEFRIDSFTKQYKELTPEIYYKFASTLKNEVMDALQLFNPEKNETENK